MTLALKARDTVPCLMTLCPLLCYDVYMAPVGVWTGREIQWSIGRGHLASLLYRLYILRIYRKSTGCES